MLILTEKPSVAASFASALGVPGKGQFYENETYCIVNALGHLLEAFYPEDYSADLKKWKLESLPIIPPEIKYKPIEKTLSQLEIIKKCFTSRKNDVLLLATDAEREGELIGDEILKYAGFSSFSNAKRFWVSEALTKEVILKGIENSKPLSDYVSYKDQGYARAEADRLIGMNLTRLISLKSGKLLTIGRVQTAVLTAIYEREKEIETFSKEKYVEVTAALGSPSNGPAAFITVKLVNKENLSFPFRFKEGSPFVKEIAAKKNVLKQGKVTSVEKEKKTLYPPKLLNLTALQKEAHKKFSYSPEQTLNIAQALYEKHKCLSYPRTPSRVMGDDNAALVKDIFNKIKDVYPELKEGADISFISKDNKRVFNSKELQDHHAIIPLAPLPETSSEEEKNVFSITLKYFFNVFKCPYVYNAVSISVDIDGFLFKGNGSEIINRGFKTEQDGSEENEEKEEKEENYAGINEGDILPLSSLSEETKYTEPKKRHTFTSLLQLMENPRNKEGVHLQGLGTPATRGGILAKLFDRNYLSQKGKNIMISQEGKFLIENILKNTLLSSFVSIPETTRWEEELHNNTSGFITGIKNFVRDVVSNTSIDIYKEEKTSIGKCPLCSGEVYEGKKNYYCGNYKEKECKFVIWKETAGASVSPEDAGTLLLGKKTKVKKCRNKEGKPFEASFQLLNGKVQFIFPEKNAKK